MHLSKNSAAGARLLASLQAGVSLTRAARAAGVGKETARRWVREEYDRLRSSGLSPAQAQEQLGFVSVLMPRWDQAREAGDGRHHRRRPASGEAAFWSVFDDGAALTAAAVTAGVGRATAYRWVQARYRQLRTTGTRPGPASRSLRVNPALARRWEQHHQQQLAGERQAAQAARHEAVMTAAGHAQALLRPRREEAVRARHARYWQLVGEGLSNRQACEAMSLHPKTGQRIRDRGKPRSTMGEGVGAGRYLTLLERVQMADLVLHGVSIRAIALELGRAPSTVSRELRRHRDSAGRYLPHQAERTAAAQRRRPRPPKLVADSRLREVVQRKLNRYWSPEQIAGWLHDLHPHDPGRRVCTETIYRALLVPRARCLHARYTAKLRTGRRLRRPHAYTRSRRDGAVRDMVMIGDRPTAVAERIEVGHWEGDLIIGRGSASAMITLRERVTHYGIIVNLPTDHTAATVTAALTATFTQLPSHLARTLTWDQGTEMARHRDLAAATGLRIYFAERSSPWQRGANENFNGLVRQFFPKNTDLAHHSDDHVATVMRLINDRPRKSLGYRTPNATFRTALATQ